MKTFSPDDIIKVLGNESIVKGNVVNFFFTNIKPIHEASEDSLVWISSIRNDKEDLIRNTKAKIIICDDSIDTSAFKDKCFIIVSNPRLSFIRIADAIFTPKPTWGIHPTAFVDPEARIHPNCFVGPFPYIGKATIGDGCILYGHNHIYDNVVIGQKVIIHAGTVIGADGFGYEKNESGEFEKFPHIGGVIIEDNVEIGSNTCIDR